MSKCNVEIDVNYVFNELEKFKVNQQKLSKAAVKWDSLLASVKTNLLKKSINSGLNISTSIDIQGYCYLNIRGALTDGQDKIVKIWDRLGLKAECYERLDKYGIDNSSMIYPIIFDHFLDNDFDELVIVSGNPNFFGTVEYFLGQDKKVFVLAFMDNGLTSLYKSLSNHKNFVIVDLNDEPSIFTLYK